jgi:hypothetical protein
MMAGWWEVAKVREVGLGMTWLTLLGYSVLAHLCQQTCPLMIPHELPHHSYAADGSYLSFNPHVVLGCHRSITTSN